MAQTGWVKALKRRYRSASTAPCLALGQNHVFDADLINHGEGPAGLKGTEKLL